MQKGNPVLGLACADGATTHARGAVFKYLPTRTAQHAPTDAPRGLLDQPVAECCVGVDIVSLAQNFGKPSCATLRTPCKMQSTSPGGGGCAERSRLVEMRFGYGFRPSLQKFFHGGIFPPLLP